MDGRRFKKPNYAWTVSSFAKVQESLFVTVERSYKSHRLAAQGAARQINLLSMSEKLAASYTKSLTYDTMRLVVQQNLLPFLWQTGALGGRRYEVLMTSLPMKNLQERLDFAASLHPTSRTLADFRADKKLVEAETEALRSADKIVTAHTAIAALFQNRAEFLNWKIPPPKVFDKKRNEKFTIVFPASTVGRKGCYELREAIQELNVKLIVLDAQLEGADFWRGVDWEKGGDNDWLALADLFVLPAFVEHQPRRLLQAVANEIPVIASKSCGLETIETVKNIEAGNIEELRNEINKLTAAKINSSKF
jgi:hypothetical protein